MIDYSLKIKSSFTSWLIKSLPNKEIQYKTKKVKINKIEGNPLIDTIKKIDTNDLENGLISYVDIEGACNVEIPWDGTKRYITINFISRNTKIRFNREADKIEIIDPLNFTIIK